MTTAEARALIPIEKHAAGVILKAVEDESSTYEELEAAAKFLTAAMGKLMELRATIVERMRKTGRLK